MERFLKENWFKASLLIIFVVFIAGAFYWFQLRPSWIRKECSKNLGGSGFGLTADIESGAYLNRYNKCLSENGLER